MSSTEGYRYHPNEETFEQTRADGWFESKRGGTASKLLTRPLQ